MLSHFRELWYDSYLLSLRESCRDLHQVEWNDKISIDDIVLVKLLNKSRPYWVLGRVLELVKGHDDKVRSVKLKRGDGVIVHHSINHLYPLELSLTHKPHFPVGELSQDESHDVDVTDMSSGSCEPDQSETTSVRRPRRTAAIVGRNKVQSWARKLRM